jgi:hypothetical protein
MRKEVRLKKILNLENVKEKFIKIGKERKMTTGAKNYSKEEKQ